MPDSWWVLYAPPRWQAEQNRDRSKAVATWRAVSLARLWLALMRHSLASRPGQESYGRAGSEPASQARASCPPAGCSQLACPGLRGLGVTPPTWHLSVPEAWGAVVMGTRGTASKDPRCWHSLSQGRSVSVRLSASVSRCLFLSLSLSPPHCLPICLPPCVPLTLCLYVCLSEIAFSLSLSVCLPPCLCP